MAKNDTVEKTQDEQSKDAPMTKAEVDPHAGLVKMHKGGQTIHAHQHVVQEHEKNGWKVG